MGVGIWLQWHNNCRFWMKNWLQFCFEKLKMNSPSEARANILHKLKGQGSKIWYFEMFWSSKCWKFWRHRVRKWVFWCIFKLQMLNVMLFVRDGENFENKFERKSSSRAFNYYKDQKSTLWIFPIILFIYSLTHFEDFLLWWKCWHTAQRR